MQIHNPMNVFLDTSVFVSENFFVGRKIQSLGKLGNQGFISLFITSVNDLEIKNRISIETNNLKETENSFLKQLEAKHKIIKNVLDVSEINRIHDVYLGEAIIEKYERFKEFAKIKVTTPKYGFDITSIINNYFNKKPPFGDNKKKSEFPDAISIQICEDYLSTVKSKGIYLTNDTDFNCYQSSLVEIKNNISEVIELVMASINPSFVDEKEELAENIKRQTKIFVPYIEKELELDISVYLDSIFEELNIAMAVEVIEFVSLEVTNVEVFDFGKTWVGFNCGGVFKTTATIISEEGFEAEVINLIFSKTNTKLSKDGKITMAGEFETSIYFEFEFPYVVLDETIEISEDKAVKNIQSL